MQGMWLVCDEAWYGNGVRMMVWVQASGEFEQSARETKTIGGRAKHLDGKTPSSAPSRR